MLCKLAGCGSYVLLSDTSVEFLDHLCTVGSGYARDF